MNRRIDIPVRLRFNAGSDSAVNGIPEAKFPKSAHLLKHADFQRVYEKGKRHFSGNVTVFFLRREAPTHTDLVPDVSGEVKVVAADVAKSPLNQVDLPGPRVGFTVGRVLGGSVQRNRIRRRTREAVRQYYSLYLDMPVDIVIHPKKTVLKVDFVELSSEIKRAFEIVHQRSQSGATTQPGDQPSRASRPRQHRDRAVKGLSGKTRPV